MTNDEIRELIQIVMESGVAELEVQRGDNKVRIRRSFGLTSEIVVPQGIAPVVPAPAPQPHSPAPAQHSPYSEHADVASTAPNGAAAPPSDTA